MKRVSDTAPFRDIAERLLAAQESLGVTAKSFAEGAGLSKTQMSNWQTGQVRISLEGALALRETYGLSLDFIYFGNLDALPYRLAKELASNPRVSASQ